MPERHAPCRSVFLIRDLGHGGAQRQLVTLARALAARGGFEVTVVHFYPGPFEKELQAAGVKTVCVGKRWRWDLLGFFVRLVRVMRGLRPEVIHGYLHESNLMALALKPLCGFPRVVWGIRDSKTDADTWGVLGKLSFRLNCLFSGFADCIIANSCAGRDYYAQQGYPEGKFEVVPNGIDTDRFQPAPGGGGNTFTLIGRLHPMKDLATFIRALAVVPGVSGRIIGSGDAAYAAEMRRLAETLAVAERLSWEPARDDLPKVYPGLDCVVSTSAFEGFSNVLGEAMACGVACIASDAGDSAWLVGDGRWVFPAGNMGALVDRMNWFVNLTPEERAALGRKNRQRVLDHFTVDRMVERTAEIMLPGSRQEAVVWITTGLGTGGAEMMLAQLVTGLKGYRHKVISLTAGGKHVETMRAAGAAVFTLDMPAGRPTLAGLWRMLKLMRQVHPAVTMGWMYHGCLAAVLARLAVRTRVVWNIRQSLYDLSLEKRGSALVIRTLAWLSRIPEVITYNSKVSAGQHEALGYSATKTRLVPNGFDVEKWAPLKPGAEKRGGMGRFGRYTAMKDYPVFLEAAALVLKEMPGVSCRVAGTGVEETNEELMARVRQLGLTGCVEVLGERDDLPELTAGLDVAVSSSAFGEGFPNVVGEAMACGVPVVATDIGDTAWVMGDTGCLVPPQDARALAEACLKVLRLPEAERLRMGQAGRERILRHFSLEQVLRQFEDVLSPRLPFQCATKTLTEADGGVRAPI
ncbi:glycosyltransferase [Prosthecobacter sp. SYSU 5D2]|uniref:glycosyltransferase n=1 Tax=Prosthecobacter sp. SYSU 5D2 TaxID=3134134 RepID=UPI0031FEF039